jgi:hypothetical protein
MMFGKSVRKCWELEKIFTAAGIPYKSMAKLKFSKRRNSRPECPNIIKAGERQPRAPGQIGEHAHPPSLLILTLMATPKSF